MNLFVSSRPWDEKLGEAVKAAVLARHGHGRLVGAEKVTRGTRVHYSVVVKTGGRSLEVEVDGEGRLLKDGSQGSR